jgi:hypothetical protein
VVALTDPPLKTASSYGDPPLKTEELWLCGGAVGEIVGGARHGPVTEHPAGVGDSRAETDPTREWLPTKVLDNLESVQDTQSHGQTRGARRPRSKLRTPQSQPNLQILRRLTFHPLSHTKNTVISMSDERSQN